jgi:hypothetical protein
MATTFMSSFLFSGFKNASPSQEIQKLEIYGIVHVLFTEMKKEGNAFFALGYDIGLRNWIGETNKGSFELHNPTPKSRSAKHQPVQSQEISQEIDQESSHEEFPVILNNWDTRFTALYMQHNFLVARYNGMVDRMDKLERAFKNHGFATGDSIPKAAEEVNALVARMPQTVDISNQQTNSSSEDDEKAVQEKPVENAKKDEDYEISQECNDPQQQQGLNASSSSESSSSDSSSSSSSSSTSSNKKEEKVCATSEKEAPNKREQILNVEGEKVDNAKDEDDDDEENKEAENDVEKSGSEYFDEE